VGQDLLAFIKAYGPSSLGECLGLVGYSTGGSAFLVN
jgi:hypothetical protein|tara:strand:- start:56 stop:166 length:111 start_codon:yes stop_codon:yes gene_type:complete